MPEPRGSAARLLQAKKKAGSAVVHTRRPALSESVNRLLGGFARSASSVARSGASVFRRSSRSVSSRSGGFFGRSSSFFLLFAASGKSQRTSSDSSEHDDLLHLGIPLNVTRARAERAARLHARLFCVCRFEKCEGPQIRPRQGQNGAETEICGKLATLLRNAAANQAASFSIHSGKKLGSRADQPGAVAAASLID